MLCAKGMVEQLIGDPDQLAFALAEMLMGCCCATAGARVKTNITRQKKETFMFCSLS